MRNRSPDRATSPRSEPADRGARAFAAALLLAALAAPARGQDADESAPAADQLAHLKQQLAERQAAVITPALREYRLALANLEAELVKARDYRSALGVQRERLSVESRITRLASGSDSSSPMPAPEATEPKQEGGRIVLAPEDAVTGGGVRFDERSGALVGWESPGAFAEWSLPDDLSTGGWEIEVTHAAGGGTVRFREAFYTLTRELEPTGDDGETFATRRVGTIRLRSGSRSFRVEAPEGSPPPEWRLRGLRLLAADRDHP